MAVNATFRDAWRDHREMLMCGALYVLVIVGEAVFCGVTPEEFSRVGFGLALIVLKCVFLLCGIGLVAYLRGIFLPPEAGLTRLQSASRRIDSLQQRYLGGEVFAHGCVAMLVLCMTTFFFVHKSLIFYINAFWFDPALVTVDRIMHFGHLPQDFIAPIVEKFSLGGLLDVAYFFWFGVMYLIVGYSFFWDNDRKRRLRFLWVFFLSWVLLGSLMATVFSAAGPVFFHNYYPDVADPYKDLVAYLDEHGPKEFMMEDHSRWLLLAWTTNGKMVNPNAINAFPSMHIAIAWLTVLYAFTFGRKRGIAALTFAGLIFMATVFFGFHYAVDGYVSVALVTLLWWACGKYIDRLYPGDVPRLRRI